MSKSFLVAILALAVVVLPARASIVEYCSSGCGSNGDAQFTATIATDNYSLQGLTTFILSDLSGSVYTDPTTGITFADFQGHPLSVSGGVLSTPVSQDTILITIPSTYLAITMTVQVAGGLCNLTPCEGMTSGTLSFINNDSPTTPWIVGISPQMGNGTIQISNFNAATAQSQSPTPEVGTFLLIGFGLLSMRWMKRWPRRFFHQQQTA